MNRLTSKMNADETTFWIFIGVFIALLISGVYGMFSVVCWLF